MKAPVVAFVCFWVLGVALAFSLDGHWLFLIPCALLCLLLVRLWLTDGWSVSDKHLFLCLISLIVSIGYAYGYDQFNQTSLTLNPQESALVETPMELVGTIVSAVEVDGDRVSFIVKSKQVRFLSGSGAEGNRADHVQEKLQISLRLMTKEELNDALQWRRADAISMAGVLKEPSTARNFAGFDYQRYLRTQHIHWLVSAKGLTEVKVTSVSAWNRYVPARWNDQLRLFLGAKMNSLFSAEQAGFMQSLLIGLRNDLDPEQFQQFSQIGLTHILAISGLHVAVFLGACMGLLRLAGVTRETNLMIAMILIPIYVVVSGASPSVLRAGLMALIALYAARRRLLKDGLHIISIVGFAMLLYNPYYLLNVSFQLSFLVTIGLIIGVPRCSKLLPISTPWLNSSVAVTTVAQLVSFPLSIYYFNQFSLLSWGANLLLVPLISLVVLPAGYASLFISFISQHAGIWLAWLIEKINTFCFAVINKANEYLIFQMIWPSPSWLWIVLYYILLAYLVWNALSWKQSRIDVIGQHPQTYSRMTDAVNIDRAGRGTGTDGRSPMMVVFSLSIMLALLWFGYHEQPFRRYGEVNFLDVGQGDAIFIRTASGQTVLIDGGGTLSFRKPGEEWKERKDPYEVGKKLLVPLLKKRGVHHLDYVIISHFDTDHFGGLHAVLEQIPVRNVLFNGTLKSNKQVEKLLQVALDKGIPLRVAIQGNGLELDRHTSMHFLYPSAQPTGEITIENDQNDESIVLLMKMYNSTFLFTGDMESQAEAELVSIVSRDDRVSVAHLLERESVDVLKVAHHGSKTSTSQLWLDYWKPRLSVISVGQYNVYGHPYPKVIERLQDNQVGILRTDLHGEVQMKVSPNSLQYRYKFP